jgi:translation initiation factor 5B
MAPKKKASKKAQEDWESELGETIDPIKQAEQEAKAADAVKEEEENGMGGGLMAALKKNRNRKKARGVAVEEDGEVEEGSGAVAPEVDLESKAPQEATFDNDEEDVVFGGPSKKAKGGGKGAQKQQQQSKDEDEDEEDGAGRMKTKKEKEKEKKEREKQRKKEQVCLLFFEVLVYCWSCLLTDCLR